MDMYRYGILLASSSSISSSKETLKNNYTSCYLTLRISIMIGELIVFDRTRHQESNC